MGLRAHARGDLEAAKLHYESVLTIDPSNVSANGWLGTIEAQRKNVSRARALLENALSSRDDPDFLLNYANLLQEIGECDQALVSYLKVIKKRRNPVSLSNLGACYNELNQPYLGLDCADQSLAIDPNYAEAWSNRGVALKDLGRHEEALASHERAIELKPDYAKAWLNRGVALSDLRRHEEALASYERAIALNPDYAEAWCNRGVALSDLQRHEHAIASYNRAIEFKPDYADAYWNKSLHLLRLGNFDQGWQLYEWRWQYDKFSSPSRNFPQPLWLGDASLEGRTILLHSEQGFGDSIQFCRYAKLVKKLGARVVLEIESPLVELFTTLEGVDEIVEKGAMLPHFDYHCPLLSLPLAFKTTLTKIPRDVPYLYSGKAKREQWAQHLSMSRDKPSIGIVWSGNPKHKNDHNRSIRLEDMSQVFSDKFHWFSLQKDVPKAEHLLLRSAGVRDHSSKLRGFSDTAGLISQLDLVISVDTSVAHLAGALGKPVWVLLPYVPDFRWMWDHEDSPWYPHMRLFRQSSEGDWGSVNSRIHRELFRVFDVKNPH